MRAFKFIFAAICYVVKTRDCYLEQKKEMVVQYILISNVS